MEAEIVADAAVIVIARAPEIPDDQGCLALRVERMTEGLAM